MKSQFSCGYPAAGEGRAVIRLCVAYARLAGRKVLRCGSGIALWGGTRGCAGDEHGEVRGEHALAAGAANAYVRLFLIFCN